MNNWIFFGLASQICTVDWLYCSSENWNSNETEQDIGILATSHSFYSMNLMHVSRLCEWSPVQQQILLNFPSGFEGIAACIVQMGSRLLVMDIHKDNAKNSHEWPNMKPEIHVDELLWRSQLQLSTHNVRWTLPIFCCWWTLWLLPDWLFHVPCL